MTKNRRLTGVLVGGGGLLLGVLFFGVGFYLWRDSQELRRRGVTVSALVLQKLQKAEERSADGLQAYFLRCGFPGANGETNEVELKVPPGQWHEVQENTPVTVSWLPGQPDSARLGSLWAPKLLGLAGAVMMCFGALAAIMIPAGGLVDIFRSRSG
jgi:hypothetical protein